MPPRESGGPASVRGIASPTTTTMSKTAKALMAVAVLLVAAILIGPRIARFLAIDRCLDRGGAWDYGQGVCKGERWLK